jgi:dethiobiotin synthetase
LGLKPLAAGASLVNGHLCNDDALRLQQVSTVSLSYEQVNPVVFAPAIAPHIAAAQAGKRVSVASLAGFVRGAFMQPADFRLIEGAGGWLVPVNEHEPLSALPKMLELDVILVVGLKLGCINHALLTARAIRHDGLSLAAWVATQVDEHMPCVQENLAALTAMLGAPCLGFIPYQPDINAEKAAECLNLPA